ncbi:MAG: FKBP-type peptidyl-prolyl cis-trans isomerase, partial [Haliea sp.]
MKISHQTVASFHYTLRNSSGEDLETSRDGEATAYLHGANNIIPALETALEGLETGAHTEITLAPEQAYGERRE